MEIEKYVGIVVWFGGKKVEGKNKGYGFISRENEADLFVHYSDIECEGFKTLRKGDKVAFSIGTNNRGQPKAINVVVIENA